MEFVDSNFIALVREFGWSYIVALLIGLAVSLDVAGLLISQHKDWSGERIFKEATLSALRHAFTHSSLFLVYFYGVWALLIIPAEFFKVDIPFLPDIDSIAVLKTTALLSSIMIIIFVWFTYVKKIMEDHYAKFEDNANNFDDMRIDVRFIFFLTTLMSSKADDEARLTSRLNYVLALAVAVDMLAITSFIRVFFRVGPDTANITPSGDTGLLHFDFGVGEYWDPLVFAGIIFGVVFGFSCFAILVSRELTDSRNKWLNRLRLLEPFLVFWLLVVALDHLFGNVLTSIGAFWIKVALGALVSALLTLLLVLTCGWEKIKNNVAHGSEVTISAISDKFRATEDKNFKEKFIRAGWYLFALTVLIVIVFFISHNPKVLEKGNAVELFLSLLSQIFSILALLVLFLANKSLADKEYAFAKELQKLQKDTEKIGHLGNRAIWYSFGAYFVVVAYIYLSFPAESITSSGFLTPLLYIGALFFFAWLLLVLRFSKSYFFRQVGEKSKSEFFFTTPGDVLTAFALVIFCSQYLWSFGRLFQP
jgi:hypothetical protein